MSGNISLGNSDQEKVPVQILRDTGAMQSFVLTSVLPFSDESFCGKYAVCKGIEMKYVTVPLHYVYLNCDLVTGKFKVAVCESLPVEGITFILGNDLTGNKILPVLEVTENARESSMPDDLLSEFPNVFPACVVTRAKARQGEDEVNLSETFFVEHDDLSSTPLTSPVVDPGQCQSSIEVAERELKVGRQQLIAAQKADPSLVKHFLAACSSEEAAKRASTFYVDKDVLM